MSLLRKIANIADDFLSLLFPRVCQACGEVLVRNERVLCLNCLADIPYTNYHLERNNDLEKELWGRCYAERVAAMCFYRHGSKIQTLIHRLKYYRIKDIGPYLGEMYGVRLKNSDFLDGIDFIVPVPLHPSKKRLRGFNQSELIARGLSSISDIPINMNILRRAKRSSTQTRKSRVERWENVEGVFELQSGELTDGKHILLIDDVITTGSTIESCINTLKGNWDVKVSVVAMAVAVK